MIYRRAWVVTLGAAYASQGCGNVVTYWSNDDQIRQLDELMTLCLERSLRSLHHRRGLHQAQRCELIVYAAASLRCASEQDEVRDSDEVRRVHDMSRRS